MWGEPRKGTEAYLVKQEAERKKKIAEDNGLDQLVIDVYHECLKYYPSWIKDERNKKWVIPEVSEANVVGNKHSDNVEFKFQDNYYKINRSDRWIPEFSDDGTWYKITLFLNDKKVFEVTEEETSDQYSDYHKPISVSAYLNNDWVDDFKNILSHKKKISAQSEIEFAEDPKRIQELRASFGINKNPDELKQGSGGAINKKISNKPFWKRWWFWLLILYFLWILLSQ